LKNWLIQLEPSDTEDSEPRRIPILDELYEILKAIPRAIHDPYVFLYKGKPIRDLRTGLRDACRKAGITYGRFKKDGKVFPKTFPKCLLIAKRVSGKPANP